MNRILIVVFDSERQAYAGYQVLKELHNEGTITLYDETVIAKDASGQASIKEPANGVPVGTVVGMVTGALVGLIGGPLGMAIGAAAGTTSGALFDLTDVGVSTDYLRRVADYLSPGKAALVAEVEEEWVLPVDTRMEAAGGTVYRRTRGEILDAQFSRDVAALEAEIDAMQAEYEQASGEAKAKLQAKIDATKADLQATRDRAKARAEAMRSESQAKVASVQAQMDKAREERKQRLAQRQTEIQAEYQERAAKLHQAGELRTQARELTKEALVR